MTQPAKAQEPSMEEILASIRRIIADDDAAKTAKPAEPPPPPPPKPAPVAAPKAAAPPPPPPPPPPPAPPPAPPKAATNNQDEIDAMLADIEVAPKVPPKPAPKPAPVPDVLDLTEAMAAPPPPPPAAPPPSSFRTIDGASDVVFTDRVAPPGPAAPPPPAAPVQALLSSSTMAAVDTAFNSLAHTVLGNNARTLEDLVKEMLRPMLKSWLDDNLPGLVERIVRAEIERVSRGR
ncbi:MAG: PopZ family protein [Pseudolabrys sp.]